MKSAVPQPSSGPLHHGNCGASQAGEAQRLPSVTVVTVVKNKPEDLAMTVQNVAGQNYPHLEYIVVDGCSTDRTLDVIKECSKHITKWVSEPDFGPYDAMNKAASMATGEYIIFMNAGDWFMGNDAIQRALRFAPDGADFVIGHHIYRQSDQHEALHCAEDFEQTWRRLTAGEVDGSWLQGIPGHQATGLAPIKPDTRLGWVTCLL